MRVHLLLIPCSLAKVVLVIYKYLFYGLCDSVAIRMELGQNLSFRVKSVVLSRGESLHMCNKNIRILKFVAQINS